MRLIFHTHCELCEGAMTTFSSAFINLPIKLLAVMNFHQLIVLTIISCCLNPAGIHTLRIPTSAEPEAM